MGVIGRLHALKRTVFNDSIAVYQGVAVRDNRLFDAVDHEPEYKTALIETIRNHVEEGDRVVIVGGGRGVAAVHAARAGGHVSVFEAAEEMVSTLLETAALNDVRFETHHAVVGQPRDVYGTVGNASHVHPSELEGDVLVLDCEGAEQDILPVDGFRTVIAETHPEYGADTDAVLSLLSEGRVVAPDEISGDVVVA